MILLNMLINLHIFHKSKHLDFLLLDYTLKCNIVIYVESDTFMHLRYNIDFEYSFHLSKCHVKAS